MRTVCEWRASNFQFARMLHINININIIVSYDDHNWFFLHIKRAIDQKYFFFNQLLQNENSLRTKQSI